MLPQQPATNLLKSTSKTLKVAVEGCGHGDLDKIYSTISGLEEKNQYKVDLLIICGDFQAVRNYADLECLTTPLRPKRLKDFHKYYSGEKTAPILTLVIGGNHEASNYMQELYHGGWLAHNLYYLGRAGSVIVNGVRISGTSGIFAPDDYKQGVYEKLPYDEVTIRSVYHTREFNIRQLSLLPKPQIFLSHDWPEGITSFGTSQPTPDLSLQALLKVKPTFEKDIDAGTLGSQPSMDLLKKLQPDWWLSGHMHVRFDAIVLHEADGSVPQPGIERTTPLPDDIAPPHGYPTTTRFLALDKYGPGREFLEVFDICPPPTESNPSIPGVAYPQSCSEERQPVSLWYDPHWLAITRAFQPYLSTTRDQNPLPTEKDAAALVKKELEWVLENVPKKLRAVDGTESWEIERCQKFTQTAPVESNPGNGKLKTEGAAQPPWYSNPQTTAFCEMLEIEDKVNKYQTSYSLTSRLALGFLRSHLADIHDVDPPVMAGPPGIMVNFSGNTLHAGKSINIIGLQGNGTSPESERRQVLDWLCGIAGVNHYAIQAETFDKVAPDTASWILRETNFQTWLSQESGTFWGVGIPGAGKTVLASYVVHHLRERASTVGKGANLINLFAYCRFNDSLTTAKLISGLLGQLVEKCSSALKYVCENLYASCMDMNVQPTEKELVACFTAAAHLVPSKLVVVIDALDELRDDIRERLVWNLLSLKRLIFLTSRELSLSMLDTPDIRIQAPVGDFASFINYEVRLLPKLWSLLQYRPEVLDELVQEISSKSDGMFLLAALQLSALRGITTIKSLRKAISTLPTRLTDIYELTLERIMDQSEEECALAHRAILWVTHAYQPLKVSELLCALSIELESTELDPDAFTNKNTLVSVCGGLLMIERETENVRLIHYTTYDFFALYKGSLFHSPHIFVATTCAIYLQLAQIIGHAMVHNYYYLEQFGQSHPFAKYAFRFLGYHTSRSIADGDSEISPHLFDLISRSRHVPLAHVNMDPKIYAVDYGKVIHFAALHGLPSLFKAYSQGFNDRTFREYTPLMYAIIGGHSSIVDLALSRAGVDLNAQNDQKMTALHLAAEIGHERAVQLLLGCPGIIVNAMDRDNSTPLHYASELGHDRVVQLLLGCPGINVNVMDRDSSTPLHHASEECHEPTVRLLLRSPGIHLNAQDRDGFTALHYASELGHELVVRLLLSSPGVNVNAKDWINSTPLHYASKGDHEPVVRLLLRSSNIEINAQDEDGYTALHLACYHGYTRVVQLLLGCPGIDISIQSYYGQTAYQRASMYGHKAIGCLLEMMLKPKIRDGKNSQTFYNDLSTVPANYD